ncbi:tRNA (guanosine(37)-N1)-methyltransferase TrmD [Patescibacteria group bacterium]|nr:tRNA (guanosine(37)-N1)-methyltransferase TrmD [Patescibacteria group bacterium]
MQFNVITLFPQMFDSPFAESMMKRARENKIIDLQLYNLRDWALDSYGMVDDRPFGGDVGMLIRPEPVYNALKEIIVPFQITNPKKRKAGKNKRIILITAGGKVFTQKKAEELSRLEEITLICGHYEGFDQRIHDYMVDEEISIGRYILTGGELPAMVVMDSVTRLLPGVLGKDESNKSESYSAVEIEGKIRRVPEYPQYTRPRDFLGLKVPEILVGGDPQKIKAWQKEQMKRSSGI